MQGTQYLRSQPFVGCSFLALSQNAKLKLYRHNNNSMLTMCNHQQYRQLKDVSAFYVLLCLFYTSEVAPAVCYDSLCHDILAEHVNEA